jgi:hypothetical protein
MDMGKADMKESHRADPALVQRFFPPSGAHWRFPGALEQAPRLSDSPESRKRPENDYLSCQENTTPERRSYPQQVGGVMLA